MIRRRSCSGFTLIELLIAISITAMIGLIAYRFLDSAITVGESSETALAELNQVDKFWTLLAADLEHISLRQIHRPATGADVLPASFAEEARPTMLAMYSDAGYLPDLVRREGAMLWFSRHGWVNPLALQRSNLQRVLYRLQGKQLYREIWPEFNQPVSEAPLGKQLLIDNVESLTLRFLPRGHAPEASNWVTAWPSLRQITEAVSGENSAPRTWLEDQLTTLPAAVEVVLRSESMGELRRVFVLPVR